MASLSMRMCCSLVTTYDAFAKIEYTCLSTLRIREGCLAAKKDAYTAVRTAIVFTGETRRCSKLGEASGFPSPKGFDGPGSRRSMSAAVVLLCAA